MGLGMEITGIENTEYVSAISWKKNFQTIIWFIDKWNLILHKKDT